MKSKSVIVILLTASLSILMLISSSAASDTIIRGQAFFKCNLLSKYMKKHGYSYIGETLLNLKKSNLFAAKNTEIVIKNKYGAVMISGKTDDLGKYTLTVPSDNNYIVSMKFQNRVVIEKYDKSAISDIRTDFGYFSSEEVENWFYIPPLTYCYTCNLRYLEMRDSF